MLSNILLTIAFVGCVWVATTLFGLHFLRREVGPISSPISEYAIGKHGVWMKSALGAWSISGFAFLFSQYLRQPESPAKYSFAALLLLFALGLAVAAVFPMDLPFPPEGGLLNRRAISGPGQLHLTGASLATICFRRPP